MELSEKTQDFNLGMRAKNILNIINILLTNKYKVNVGMEREKKIKKNFTISPKIYEQALDQAKKLD